MRKVVILSIVGALVAASIFAQDQEVTITSNVPGSQVFIDGRSHGSAPVSVRLSPGSHDLRISAPGYHDVTENIVIPNYSFTLQPAPLAVNISANAPAQITVDGQVYGTTPNEIMLMAGTYTLSLAAPGYLPFETTVTVTREPSQGFSYSLEPEPAVLIVEVPPELRAPGAGSPLALVRVYVDGQLAGSGDSLGDVSIEPGNRSVTVVSGGLSFSRTVSFESGRRYVIKLSAGMQVTSP